MRRRDVRPSALVLLALAAVLGGVGLAGAEVVQSGDLRVTVSTRLTPYRLPRTGTVPVGARIAGHIATVDGGVPPQLVGLDILVNRHGRIETAGLPSCTLDRIQPGSNARALRECGAALVGSGHFWATVVFAEDQPYHTTGRLLIFAGQSGGRPVVLAHIFTTQPFPTSFVIAFAVKAVHQGPWGTELSASLPQALGDWGYLDRIKLNLGRTYRLPGGGERGYLEAGCPAPAGARTVVFPLARAELQFADGEELGETITRPCGVARE